MSGGRLVILPKKSYCPWKPENVERVLRDERLEKERLTQESTRSERLAILREVQKTLSSSPQQDEHVNLFQQEEEESYRTGVLQGSGNGKGQQQVRGILPVVLGQSELEARGDNRPFYLRTGAEQKLLSPKEDQRKECLDPMKDFVHHKKQTLIDTNLKRKSHLDSLTDLPRKKIRGSEERRSNARHKDDESEKQSRRHASKRSNHRDSLETLRQRRLEREAIESKRAAAASMKRDDDDGDWNDDRKRSYHNQYNAGRSRR